MTYPVPKGAWYYYKENWYKLGLHGFVYRWSAQLKEWQKSTLSLSDVEAGMTPGELWDKINNRK